MHYRILFLSLCAVVCASAQSIGSCPVLPADNIWNTPVDTLPVAANSAAFINTIGPATGMHADFGSGLWDGGPIGIPFVKVPATQTKYPATFLYADESDPGPYAVPLNAPIEGGSAATGDRHAISVDTGNCILYELYRAFPQTSSWKGDSGAIYNLRSNALRPASWTSADAAGLPILPGLARYDEVAAGEIRHALRFTVPQTRRAYVWPARHYASSLTDVRYPPMGQRFRLKASFDVSGYPADVQVILRALKKYGMILADNGSSWYLSGEPDSRWNNDNLRALRNVIGSDFEAVDVSSLMIDPNSGQARQTGASLTVSPSSATVVTQGTQQFTASQAATWAVNGVAGGNSQVGYVDAAGRYSAPSAVPNPATVTVQATSTSTPTLVGSATVTIRYPSPVISSIAPTSIPTGSFTLTINGTGFQTGAVAKLNGAALSTTFVSSIQMRATGNATTAGALPVTVTNPDGQVSAPVNITVVSNAAISVTVSPASTSVRYRRQRQFTATVQNTTDKRVTWKVNGVAGGNSTVGTITAAGLYTAPRTVPNPSTVTVSATSVADPSKTGTASVRITR